MSEDSSNQDNYKSKRTNLCYYKLETRGQFSFYGFFYFYFFTSKNFTTNRPTICCTREAINEFRFHSLTILKCRCDLGQHYYCYNWKEGEKSQHILHIVHSPTIYWSISYSNAFSCLVDDKTYWCVIVPTVPCHGPIQMIKNQQKNLIENWK